MKTNRIYILLTALFLSGCYGRGVLVVPADTHQHSTHTTIVTHHDDHRPPPYAPAHGHRHRHHNHDLRFDSGFGAYVIINTPGIYFYGDRYIRFYNDSWQVTPRLGDRWRPARQNDIPRKLKKSKRHNKKHRRHDEHRNDHRDDRNDHRSEHRRDHHDAPKHGHRRHHHDHELSFDAGIGAYIILKRPGIFYYNGRYMRHHRGKWQTTNKLNGRWHAAERNDIPRKLKKSKHAKKQKRQEKSKQSRKEKQQHKEESKGRYKERWQ